MNKDDVLYINNGILLSHEKKDKILPFATRWMSLEGVMLSKLIQTEKNQYCMISLACGRQINTWTKRTDQWLPEEKSWRAGQNG